MNGGWFAMSRAMFEHPIFKGRADRVGVWAWMVGSAAWKDTRQDANGKTVTVKRGQLLTSYRQMSRATGVPIQPLRTLISCLKEEHAITTDTNTGRLLVTICNYEKYQAQQQASNTRPTHDQHTKEQGNNITRYSVPNGTDADASPEPVSEPVNVSVLTTAMWNAGKQYLSSQGVKNPGSVIGKWAKTSKPVAILSAIEAAQKAGTQDPIPYITEVLKSEVGGNDEPDNSQLMADILARVRAKRKGETA